MPGTIIYPDLSQIEYRLIAHETREPKLVKAFNKGEDIHSNIGMLINGKLPADKAERKILKTLNYAEVYQVGLKKFTYLSELPKAEAKDKYYKMKGVYPMIDEYKEELMGQLLMNERLKLINLFGRVRYMNLYEFAGKNTDEKARNAHREAFNWIFQSSGHDILMVWMLETMDLIPDLGVRLINDVHDEFVLDVPTPLVESTLNVVKATASRLNDIVYNAFGVKLRVPLEAEIEVGETWK